MNKTVENYLFLFIIILMTYEVRFFKTGSFLSQYRESDAMDDSTQIQLPSISRPSFFAPKKNPKERLEELFHIALYLSEELRENVFHEILKLLETHKNLVNYVSKDLKANAMELAMSLGGVRLNSVIKSLEQLGCKARYQPSIIELKNKAVPTISREQSFKNS